MPSHHFTNEVCLPSLSPPFSEAGVPSWQQTDYYNRGLREYSDSLGIDFRLFRGQRLLDLGAGNAAQFANEAAEQGINVVSLNPNWSLDDRRNHSVGSFAVAGLAEALPFASNSFDFIVSFWGIPAYLPGTTNAHFDAFSSVRRVLKPNSWGLFVPVSAVSAEQPEFREVLDAAFSKDGYNLMKSAPTPKLIVYKDVSAEKRRAIDLLKPGILSAVFPIF